jgi:hypothetical protein
LAAKSAIARALRDEALSFAVALAASHIALLIFRWWRGASSAAAAVLQRHDIVRSAQSAFSVIDASAPPGIRKL